MDSRADRVRRHVRARREQLKWSETDLAEAAGVGRSTVQRLEKGQRLREGKEGAIERALGWRLGSLEVIRAGGEPIPGGDLAGMTWDEVVSSAQGIAKMIGGQEGDDAAARVIVAWSVARDEAMRKREGQTHAE